MPLLRLAEGVIAREHTIGVERGLTRFEAFTDAVFAIGLTLTIVELPTVGLVEGRPAAEGLARALAAEWPAYLALGVSWWAIGVYWLQHHFSGRIYSRTDHVFSALNLLFLLAVNVTPFPIRLWTEHLGAAGDVDTAMTVLSFALLAPAIGWMGKWLYAVQGGRLVDERLEGQYLRRMTWQYGLSTLALAGAAALSLAAPAWGLGLSLAVTFAYVLPPPSPRYKPGQEPDAREVEDADT